MAAPAIMGVSRMWKAGYRAPAATGMQMLL